MSDEFKIFIDSRELLIQSTSWEIYPYFLENKKQCYSLMLWRPLRIYFDQSYCCYFVTKSHLDLLQPQDCSPPGFSVHGSSKTRIMKWVAISFSRRTFWPRAQTLIAWSVDSLQLNHRGNPFFKVVVMRKRHISLNNNNNNNNNNVIDNHLGNLMMVKPFLSALSSSTLCLRFCFFILVTFSVLC